MTNEERAAITEIVREVLAEKKAEVSEYVSPYRTWRHLKQLMQEETPEGINSYTVKEIVTIVLKNNFNIRRIEKLNEDQLEEATHIFRQVLALCKPREES
jgi:hypothetical protein